MTPRRTSGRIRTGPLRRVVSTSHCRRTSPHPRRGPRRASAGPRQARQLRLRHRRHLQRPKGDRGRGLFGSACDRRLHLFQRVIEHNWCGRVGDRGLWDLLGQWDFGCELDRWDRLPDCSRQQSEGMAPAHQRMHPWTHALATAVAPFSMAQIPNGIRSSGSSAGVSDATAGSPESMRESDRESASVLPADPAGEL